MKRNLIVPVLVMPFLFACSSTNLMSLSVKQPAPVGLPPYIKNVAVVDRSLPSKENRTLDNIHKVLSLETNTIQAEGARASLNGLTNELMKNDRFSSVKKLDSMSLRSFGAGVFSAALPWDTVETICKRSNADALFVLEVFDAQSALNIAAGPTTINTVFGDVAAVGHSVNAQTRIKTGWRIYDPVSKTILDEYELNKGFSMGNAGINPLATADALAGRKEIIKQAANEAGQEYALRIVPYWVRVSRYYFVRGNSDFSIATRKARTGNWEGAAEIWQRQTTNPSRKIAGRACYDMAIMSEIRGDLDAAIEWAQKSYENYNNKLALSYVNLLRRRKTNNAILDAQQPDQAGR